MDIAYLDNLNSQQQQAVVFGLNHIGSLPPPLLVIAGAGSGKTSTLAHRVAHAIVCGGDPNRMLLMTFSRRAAAEMSARATKLVSNALGLSQVVELPWSGTFHSVGARLLREYATTIGLGPDFTIHDRSDSADLMDLVRHELDFPTGKARFPQKSTCLAIYSMIINTQSTAEEVLMTSFPWCEQWIEELRQLFAAYVKAKQSQHILDFDDLVLYWSHMMKVPALAADIGEKFDFVFCDEYQDTNKLQEGILLGMKPTGAGVTVVGDDAQAIYRFRAAEIENIIEFPNAFSPVAQVITLEQNYRSTQSILSAANAVIGLASRRYQKNLWSNRAVGEKPKLMAVRDEAAQAQYIAETVLANRESGDRLRDQAILFRASHHSGPLEIELARRQIPYVKYGGLRFLDTAHVKDMICILRWAQNLQDKVSGFRVLKMMPGFGPVKAGRLIDTLHNSSQPMKDLRKYVAPPVAKPYWSDFIVLMDRLSAPMLGWPADLSLAREWYAPLMEIQYDDVKARHADLLQLEQIATTFPTRQRFLTELTLDPADASSKPSADPSLDEDYLILSTIHSVKGSEYGRVFILNGVDGCIPSDLAVGEKEAIEEERRLLYVAMTRAKNSLTVMVPQNFFVHKQPAMGNRHVLVGRTRFIPDKILEHFELGVWPKGRDGLQAPSMLATVDIKHAISSTWEKS